MKRTARPGCDDPSAHCDFCLSVVPLYRRGGTEYYSKHYPENQPYHRGENECLCDGSDKRIVYPGQALKRRSAWSRARKKVSSLFRRGTP